MSDDFIYYDNFTLRRKVFTFFRLALGRMLYPHLSDESQVKLNWFLCRYHRLDLNNPQTFNEKIQYLKLHDHNPAYIEMVDKVKAKNFVASRIGWEHVIPTLAVYEKAENIDFTSLPNQFVIKCNHNSGAGMYICKDKTKIDEPAVRHGLAEGLKQDYYLHSREWPYGGVERRIIAESFLTDESGVELKDYKIHCFAGVPRIIQVDYGRFTNHHGRNLYTPQWDFIDAGILHRQHKDHIIPRPMYLGEMLDIASELSKDIPYVRVDLYQTTDQVYFGELTFYHGSGLEAFTSKELEYEMGSWIDLGRAYDNRINADKLTDYHNNLL